jgi:energy-coupling factor transporter ATP-binding protein EcfA2
MKHMNVKIDDIELDRDNVEFNRAADFVINTNKLFYLTGKAGTGKTTFLKYIKEVSNKNTVIVAPTGVAAINAGGVTINSFFQIPFSPFVPDDLRLRTSSLGTVSQENIYKTFSYNKVKRKIIETLELLIIDEISMVRCDTIDVIDRILRVFRKKPYFPFGGVQIVLIGDTFQLPPVVKNDVWNILSQFYKTPFFFSSRVIENDKPPYIELKKIYRQSEQEFIDLLNRVRVNKVNNNDYQLLNSKYDPTFSSNDSDYIILATHNAIVNETNLTKLNELKTTQYNFVATVIDDFPDKMKPTDHYLKLKVGAQIMFIKNDNGGGGRYYNGKIAKIVKLEEGQVVAAFDNGQEVEVEKAEWKNITYKYNSLTKRIEEKIIGTFVQFPIKLAWAITVHKSQGLTFEKVIADLAGAFASGQVYVALSRCTSSNGLVLKTQLHPNAIKTDPRVIEFARNETPDTLIAEELNTGKADFYYKKSREYFEDGKLIESITHLNTAITFRNDLGTKEFERYVTIHGTKLFSQKTFLFKYLREGLSKQEADIIIQQVESQAALIDGLNTVNKDLKVEKRTVQDSLNSVQSSYQDLEDKMIDLISVKLKIESENKIFVKKLEVEIKDNLQFMDLLKEEEHRSQDFKYQNFKLKASNADLKDEIMDKDKVIKNLKSTLKSNLAEFERLKSLKWYQRL